MIGLVNGPAQNAGIYTMKASEGLAARVGQQTVGTASKENPPGDQVEISHEGMLALQNRPLVNPLEQLVKVGVITQEHKDAIDQAFKDGIITDAQKNAIKNELESIARQQGIQLPQPPPQGGDEGPGRDKVLSDLVASGMLTEAQKTAVDGAIESSKGMDQKGVSSEGLKGPLGILVAEGTITAEQREAVKTALAASRAEHKPNSTEPPAELESGMVPFENALDRLVGSSTLTENQALALRSFLTDSSSETGGEDNTQ